MGAIAVGIGTAIADDPLLTARGPHALGQPLRVVFDRRARLDPRSRLVATAAEAPLLVITGPDADPDRVGGLTGAGVEVFEAGSLDAALRELGARGVNSLLLEGGATLARAFLEAGEIDELRLFIAPVLLGEGTPLYAGLQARAASDAVVALHATHERSGADILVRARLREW
jgi:diaminohydroxyphosphoribosylaminopyrimidine deaminase/5-amino-6-(5-phosphoribosylamino)uracil reductase